MSKHKQMREFTFPDSGEKVFLPVVSLTVQAMKLQRKFKRPMPPLQEVDYGNRKAKEYNWSDPDYQEKVRQYEAFIDTRATEVAVEKATKVNLTDAQQADITQWKADNPNGWDEMDDDASLWLEEIGISTDNDFQMFLEFVTGPTEEVIASVQEGFQGKVQGERPVETADSA